jgi:glutathione S-transferase
MMQLFFGRMSGNSARAYFGLSEAGAPFIERVLDTRGHENQLPDYLAINPMGKVPSLIDGTLCIWESNAINWYAAEKNPDCGLVPDSPEARASLLRWLFFQTAHVSPAGLQYLKATNQAMRKFYDFKEDPKAIEAATKELRRYLPVLEAALSGRDFLEKKFSLADVAFTPHLFLMTQGGFDFAEYPKLSAWQARVQARPAWEKVLATVFPH